MALTTDRSARERGKRWAFYTAWTRDRLRRAGAGCSERPDFPRSFLLRRHTDKVGLPCEEGGPAPGRRS